MWRTYRNALLAVAAGGLIFAGSGMALAASPSAGATLQAYKTLDICDAGGGNWIYSGVVSVWNNGISTATTGLQIQDCIQQKNASGPNFTDKYCIADLNADGFAPDGVQIPAGTTLGTATAFPYSIGGTALDRTIRNIARVKITNHSAHIGTLFGPEPKATWVGAVPSCNRPPTGCTLTQGYWGTPGSEQQPHTWPLGYNQSDPFYSSGTTWQGILDQPPAGGNGYYILGKQYIAAVLNQANGASAPSGVQDTLNLALAWFSNPLNTTASCTGEGSCGDQKDWAAVLDVYNNGLYPGGPGHCE